ncbi:hypothetical protein MPTK1_4g16680 [Marchantia polymorpha subsp. ruderalis]|uniref:Uncharacterized protein n=2 Tax=Marchantia polymorpha TaxID=3197 RepID=A0AAF6BAL0_MARPO|nr:hypothetical protein MARPO_0054s0135 [Marchantia polymorpha]BBN09044.1 hypothetical protein Mp_4g16680 [Marchantia polymorpha subsp. ruderalis]|eukprot:PTQ38035.1 hypothetical protein MARPO_0054s0135 [Marchantia polymorpha]
MSGRPWSWVRLEMRSWQGFSHCNEDHRISEVGGAACGQEVVTKSLSDMLMSKSGDLIELSGFRVYFILDIEIFPSHEFFVQFATNSSTTPCCHKTEVEEIVVEEFFIKLSESMICISIARELMTLMAPSSPRILHAIYGFFARFSCASLTFTILIRERF